LLAGCASEKPNNDSDANKAFAKLTDDFIKGYLDWRPSMGTSLGLHEYDGRITDLSSASINAEIARLKDFQTRLEQLKGKKLSPRNDYDLRMLESAIRGDLFRFIEMDSYRKNPMSYADAIDVNIYVKR